MSGQATRHRITSSAITLFNHNGVQNVTLQQIADDARISVGNLAYHFHDKEEILRRIDLIISDEIDNILKLWKDLPGFLDFNNQLAKLYHLLDHFPFYFLDMLEIKRLYPAIHNKQQEHIQAFIRQLQLWVKSNAERGLIHSMEGTQTKKMAEMIWFISSFWMTRKKILEQESYDEWSFKEIIWLQILPFMTDQGKTEYEIMILPGLNS